jgi:hypothetical protein
MHHKLVQEAAARGKPSRIFILEPEGRRPATPALSRFALAQLLSA